MQTATTAGNANFADPSRNTLEEMIPKLLGILFSTPYIEFIIQVKQQGQLRFRKSHGSMKLLEKLFCHEISYLM